MQTKNDTADPRSSVTFYEKYHSLNDVRVFGFCHFIFCHNEKRCLVILKLVLHLQRFSCVLPSSTHFTFMHRVSAGPNNTQILIMHPLSDQLSERQSCNFPIRQSIRQYQKANSRTSDDSQKNHLK